MGALIDLPVLQVTPFDSPPDLRLPRRGWRRLRATARTAGARRVLAHRVGPYELTITEGVDARIIGTVRERDRVWLLSEASTFQAWLAAMHDTEGRRIRQRG